MGLLPYDILFSPHDATNIIPFAVILLFTMGSTIIIRELYDKYSHSQKTIEYLSKTEKQLSQFNVQLQQLSRKRNETILRNERLKLTRDLHDTCGYAFTNIILLSDAAISNNKVDTDDVQELYSKIRNLAARGLQETREILHLIRKKQKLYTNTTDIVLEAKSLFEDVTGIKVEITWGNITNNYSHDINKIIVSIIQEAFTNSIKHGQASFIKINFNETYEKLFMSISDNGIGSRQIEKGIGITGMEERLNIVNGKLHISELSEGGFHLTVVIPIQ
ncbi:MAG: histidine kinase [Treponema sp.]|nr:histidine kinase [Treponema sp.]